MTMNRREFLAGCGCTAASSLLLPRPAASEEGVTFGNRICAFGGSVTGDVLNVGPPSEQAVTIVGWRSCPMERCNSA